MWIAVQIVGFWFPLGEVAKIFVIIQDNCVIFQFYVIFFQSNRPEFHYVLTKLMRRKFSLVEVSFYSNYLIL